MLAKRSTDPNFIDEGEEFDLECLGQEEGSIALVKFTKIHTLGVSSLCGLATIAEYIIRRPFAERMAIYTNILKYAHRKNLGESADSPDARNPQLKLDAIDPRYFLLVEQFQEARNEKLKSFLKEVIDEIKNDLQSTGAVSDSVTTSVLAAEFQNLSLAQMARINGSLTKLDEEDAELYETTYNSVFNAVEEVYHADIKTFEGFKELFQVKLISEIFDFASQRANILRGEEGIESSTVSFFETYFMKDNSCQLWIINLLQNYAEEVNKIKQYSSPETEDYSTEFLEVFFKLLLIASKNPLLAVVPQKSF